MNDRSLLQHLYKCCFWAIIAVFTIFIPTQLKAEAKAYHKEPYFLSSGSHDAFNKENTNLAFSETIEFSGVPWIKLHFDSYNLGIKSFVEIVSTEDGNKQRLDSKSLILWRDSSGYFNGDAVEINLYVAPEESGIFINITDITVGDRVFQIESLCGSDDRTPSTNNRIGRIEPVGCTGWLISNGAYLTAGHCTVGDGTMMDTLEFNVPPSTPDGGTNHPPIADQYPIDASSIAYSDDGKDEIGNDWAVFTVFPNTETNLLPVHSYGGFYRIIIDNIPTTVRITGYGLDDGVANSTQQTDTGAFLSKTIDGPSDVTLEYTVDSESGNSGSPVIDDVLGQSIGIHTNAGCYPPNSGNHGTGFENENLAQAIQIAPGENIFYVDGVTHDIQNGTVFWPYGKVMDAVNSISGPVSIISIVAGAYDETMQISIPATLKAPVGAVRIGK